MNHKWNYRPITPEQAETSQTLAQELGISPILGQLWYSGELRRQQMPRSFSARSCPTCTIRSFMKDMDIAVERLNRRWERKNVF